MTPTLQSPEIQTLLTKLRQDALTRKTPNVSDTNGRYLHDFVLQHSLKHILEIGTANGVSTIYLASAISDLKDGHILTIESKREAYNEAKQNLKLFDAHVTCVCADAKKHLSSLSGFQFDLIFIDAQKNETLEYFKAILPLTKPDGYIIIDDVVKFADKMQDWYEYLAAERICHEIVPTDPDDGIMILRVGDLPKSLQ